MTPLAVRDATLVLVSPAAVRIAAERGVDPVSVRCALVLWVPPLEVRIERAPWCVALRPVLRATGEALSMAFERVVETTVDGRAQPEACLVVERARARWVLGALAWA